MTTADTEIAIYERWLRDYAVKHHAGDTGFPRAGIRIWQRVQAVARREIAASCPSSRVDQTVADATTEPSE